jgi:hypothetical protein
MRIIGLALFVTLMWIMILAVTAFLVILVAPIDTILFGRRGSDIAVSIVQAAIAFAAVVALVYGLTRMKRLYLRKKLRQ